MAMLTAEQKRFYEDHGYLRVDPLIPDATLRGLREVVEEFEDKAAGAAQSDDVLDLEPERVGGKRRLRRIKNPTAHHPLFLDVATSAAVLDVVEDLLGPNLELHHSKVNLKTGRVGSAVLPHQDFPYFPHTNADLLGVMIMLDDSAPENGCLTVWPGSHKWGPLDHTHEGTFYGLVTGDAGRLEENDPVPVPVRAGGASIHHCLVAHASAENRSEKPRRAFILEYRAADAVQLNPPNPVLAHYGLLVRGERPYRARITFPEVVIPREVPTNLYELQRSYRGLA